jgi:hypothetical protein
MKTFSNRLIVIAVMLTGSFGATVGCTSYEELDVTLDYARHSAFQSGYEVGATYELQRDLFVIKMERPHARLSKPGDLAPTIAQWESEHKNKYHGIDVIRLLRAGTKLRVEKVILIKSKQGGSQLVPMLRTASIELPINPFDVSELDHTTVGATLSKPDIRFLKVIPTRPVDPSLRSE